MGTQRPLAELMPAIVAHLNQYLDFSQFNLTLYEMLEGQVRKQVEDSLRKEILSHAALTRALQRIPSINVLRKSTEKLSKVYVEHPSRLADNDTDRDVMSKIVRDSNMNRMLQDANRIYNAQNMFALEPYVQNRQHKMRVLAGHQFLPFSDNPSNPAEMTVFIKFLGPDPTSDNRIKYDDSGQLLQNTQIREIDLFALYSDTEFLIMDGTGTARYDLMEMWQLPVVNPFGRIPFVYRSKSSLQLIPFPNQEAYDITVLVPKLLTDLNYAAQFMSHSIIWTKNTDLTGQEINPDATVNLGDSTEDGDPEMGVIEPSVDIENVLRLIEYELSSYFSTVGIDTKTNGVLDNGRDTSAVGKAIDEGDVTSERKIQTEVFRSVEKDWWALMRDVQDYWSSRNVVDEKRKFSNKFVDTFRIKYAEMKPFKSEKQILEEIEMWRDQKLMTRKQALRTLRPDFTEKQIDDWIAELDKESDDEMDKMMMMPPARNKGEFGDDNDASQDRDPSPNTDDMNG